MDKKRLYHYHKRLQLLNAWYFLAAALIFLVIAVYGLRQNNFTMIRLRQAVITADQQNGDTAKALNELRAYVYGHMNTNLASGDFAIRPPIQLKNRYDKLVTAEQDRVKALNQAVTTEAENICGQQFPAAGPNIPRLNCIQQYITDHAVKPQEIPADLYKFDFLSPRWSPDLAGISLVLSGLFFCTFVLRYSVERWFIRNIK
jgi:hypothetical protein